MSVVGAPDHVAVAVPDPEVAASRWHDRLGGGLLTTWDNGSFSGRQYRFANLAKVELLAPSEGDTSPDNFVRAFLAKFGTRIHHLTLKVDDIHDAIAEVRDGGFDLVDVDTDRERWKQAFLRPSQVGGLVVQVGWSPHTDDEWAASRGSPPQKPREDGARFHGLRLRHPDLGAARELWELLGAKTDETDAGRLRCRWDANPIEVHISAGEPAGPAALRMAGSGDLPADEGVGPRIEDVGDD